jgi:cytochrome c oxidase cbb3-type subunit 4
MAEFIQSLWLVWLILLFVGIVAWVYWPKRKKRLDEAAHIPLKDDEES